MTRKGCCVAFPLRPRRREGGWSSSRSWEAWRVLEGKDFPQGQVPDERQEVSGDLGLKGAETG